MSEDTVLEKKFLLIKSIRTSSNAFVMKLREEDIIISLDGELMNISYDDFSKKLKDLKQSKILTLYRDGVFFNISIKAPLGVICEEINSETITNLNSYKPIDNIDLQNFYQQFEVFKKSGSTAILMNTFPTILASLAPPLWMIQNKLWNFFAISLVFYIVLLMISPWLFFIGWILKSWYVGNSQIDILRFFYRLNNYRLSLIFCAINEKEAQETARKLDTKIDFYYSYLEPVVLED